MSRTRTVAGFTLVEVLVGLALTALIATGLYSALFAVGRAGRGSTAQNRANDSERLVGMRLRELLENSVPLVEGNGDDTVALFRGGRDYLRFVGHIPAHASGGGLQFIELRASAEHARRRLNLAFREAWPEVPFDDVATGDVWTREPLLEIDSIEISYYSARDERRRAAWMTEWPTGSQRPALVRIEITPAGLDPWPPLIFPLRIARSEATPIWYRQAPK